MREAMKIPEPVAESQLKLKTAASGELFATTGGTRTTILSSHITGIFGADSPSSRVLTCGKPQMKTTTLRMIHGSHARRMVFVLCAPPFAFCSDIRQTFFGVQSF